MSTRRPNAAAPLGNFDSQDAVLHCYRDWYGCRESSLERTQLEWARQRFAEMRDSVPALGLLAAQRGVDDVVSCEDLAKVLFPYTVYKSYPLSALEGGDFVRLTQWLDRLTVYDLRGVDVRGLSTLDDWIERLDASTNIRLVHSFGTTGKLTFLPRSQQEWNYGGLLIGGCIRDWTPGRGRDLAKEPLPFIQPHYAHGASAPIRGVRTLLNLYGRQEDAALFLYPDERFSADVAVLAGRLNGKGSSAGLGSRALDSALAKYSRHIRALADRPRRITEFFDEMRRCFVGKDVYLFGVWPTLYEWAKEARARGLSRLFGPNSILHCGGGTKGVELPSGWREQIFETLGFERSFEFYAMTEMIPACPRCSAGNYHVPPVLLPLLLDKATGALLPRAGTRTGRFAFFDALATTYWGGFVTGDEVTMAGWDDTCGCGRTGPYVFPEIRRLSESEGGDDKISCAGQSASYAAALACLARSA